MSEFFTPQNPVQSRRARRNRGLPLPTLEEQDAMTGQRFWKDSTGKGLESLARSGQQKLDALNRADANQGSSIQQAVDR